MDTGNHFNDNSEDFVLMWHSPEELKSRLDYQPLFENGARAPPVDLTERAAEIEPNWKATKTVAF